MLCLVAMQMLCITVTYSCFAPCLVAHALCTSACCTISIALLETTMGGQLWWASTLSGSPPLYHHHHHHHLLSYSCHDETVIFLTFPLLFQNRRKATLGPWHKIKFGSAKRHSLCLATLVRWTRSKRNLKCIFWTVSVTQLWNFFLWFYDSSL